jgi:hypothetical protein
MGRMGWQNAIATILTGVIVGIYVVFLGGTSSRLILSTRWAIAVVLLLGISAWALYTLDSYTWDFGTRSQASPDFDGGATTIEGIALLTAVIGLITGSTVALAVLVAGALILWLIAILRATARPKPVKSVGNGVSYLPSKTSGQEKGEVLKHHYSAVVELPPSATSTVPDQSGPDRANS